MTAPRSCQALGRPGDESGMNAIGEWFAMGGYGAFVWPAYGLAAIVLGGLAVFSWRRHRRSLAMLTRLQGRTGTRE
jgi:heme exporter protein D